MENEQVFPSWKIKKADALRELVLNYLPDEGKGRKFEANRK